MAVMASRAPTGRSLHKIPTAPARDPLIVIAGLDPIGANIRLEYRVNDLSFETRPAGAPQDEVYRSDPHGEERREATRLEPRIACAPVF
jgi:hypothetical protein